MSASTGSPRRTEERARRRAMPADVVDDEVRGQRGGRTRRWRSTNPACLRTRTDARRISQRAVILTSLDTVHTTADTLFRPERTPCQRKLLNTIAKSMVRQRTMRHDLADE